VERLLLVTETKTTYNIYNNRKHNQKATLPTKSFMYSLQLIFDSLFRENIYYNETMLKTITLLMHNNRNN